MIRTKYAILAAACCLTTLLITAAIAQRPSRNGKLKEPVHRVAKNIDEKAVKENTRPAGHPIDPILTIAQDGLKQIQQNINDYTATLVKRETVNGKLLAPEHMFVKIRSRKVRNGRVAVPFSIYMKYLHPNAKKGQEAIWVEGRNSNKLVAHGTGLQGLITVYLDPDGYVATRGTNYRIYDSGIENLVVKLIERGQRARNDGGCQVQIYKNATINGRNCDLIEVKHSVRQPQFDFHIARIFIDKELNVPVRYAAYDWPRTAGGKPQLIEEFTYVNVRTNVGLTDADFNHKNPEYSYP